MSVFIYETTSFYFKTPWLKGLTNIETNFNKNVIFDEITKQTSRLDK